MEIPVELLAGSLTALGAFVTYIVKTLLDQYRNAIDRNTDALIQLKVIVAEKLN